jgi:integrase
MRRPQHRDEDLRLTHLPRGDVDLERQHFRVPPERPKNGKERIIPLSQTALAILAGLPRTSPWLLPNPQTGKPYVFFYHAWNTARRQAGGGAALSLA